MAGKKATGRTKQLSLKSKPKFHQKLKELAVKEKRLMIEVLEEALKLYEQVKKEKKLRQKSVNTTPQASPEPIRGKHPRDDDITESPDISKKRKIDNY